MNFLEMRRAWVLTACLVTLVMVRSSEAFMREPAPELSALPPRLPLPSLPQFALYLGCVLLLALSPMASACRLAIWQRAFPT
jgi:hypothetical protein